ncbi:hypothetical protein D9M68_577810 [compost metagenome]
MSADVGIVPSYTKSADIAILGGLKDAQTQDAFEVGYVYKHFLDKNIGHASDYHGIRGAIQIQILHTLGFYGTYDIIAGERWLYTDQSATQLKVYRKVAGEGCLGIFYTPLRSAFYLYAGVAPIQYQPTKRNAGYEKLYNPGLSLKIKYYIWGYKSTY